MTQAQILRIVVASPGDVLAERNTLEAVVGELNRGIAADRNLRLELSRWETDAYPGFHPEGPQGLIDPILRIADCDLLIGIFWKRFGTPTTDGTTGTEHELGVAYEAWKRTSRPQIMVYFNQKAHTPTSKAEAEQWGQVLEFRENFPKEGLCWPYNGKPEFERLVRNHLTQWIRQGVPLPGPDLAQAESGTASKTVFGGDIPPHQESLFFRSDDFPDTLHAAFQSEDAGQWKQVIYETGGAGKTATAAAYCHRYGNAYTHVLWTNADSPVAIETGFGTLAPVLGIPQRAGGVSEKTLDDVRLWLARNENYLLVLDNVENPADVEVAFPHGARGRLLLTTRVQDFQPLGRATPRRLPPISPDDAVNFLFAYSQRNADDAVERGEAGLLAEALGYLPKALTLAAAFLQWHTDTFAQYRADFERRRKTSASAAANDPFFTVWDRNFENVSEAKALLYMLAFLAPDDVPESVITALYRNQGGWKSHLRALQKYSLVRWDEERQSVTLHRLIQDAVKRRISPENGKAYSLRVAEAVERVFPNPHAGDSSLLDRLMPQALLCADHVKRYDLRSLPAGKLLVRASVYLNQQERYAAAQPLLATLQQKAQSLGIQLSDLQAIAGQALTLNERDEAARLNNLACEYDAQGRYAEAEPLYRRALEIREKVLGQEHPDTAVIMNNLGYLYGQQGRYAEAESLYRRVLDIYGKTLGQEHGNTANTLNNLALLFEAQGKFEDAEPLYRRSLEIREKVLGQEHFATRLASIQLIGVQEKLQKNKKRPA